MEITILADEENPMLHRRDVRFRLSHVEATPDRLAIRDSLAARLNKDADEVVIRRLDTKFGMRETIGEAKVYEAAEFAKDVEQQYMLARNKIAAGAGGAVVEPDEAAPEEEAPAEPAVTEEEPAEEPDEPADGEDAASGESTEEADEAEEEPAEAEEEPDEAEEEPAEATEEADEADDAADEEA